MRSIHVNRVYGLLRQYDRRYYISYGGRRSGKSVAFSQLLVRRALDYPGRKIMVFRKVGTTTRHSTWPRYKAAVDEAVGLENCTIRQVDKEIWLPNGSTIGFGALDDAEKTKSFEGFTDYHIEEATEVVESDFDTLDAGLSTPCEPQPSIWLSFNPIPITENYQHWLQERFLGMEHELDIPSANETAVVLRTWFRSNKWCPEETIRLFESYRESNPELWEMWGLGLFTKLKGAILRDWDIVKAVPDHARFLGYSIDWGYAADPAAVVAVWQYRREIWVQQKIYQAELTNPDLSEGMKAVGIEKFSDIVADSAEPKSIEELRRFGWLIRGVRKSGQQYKRSVAMYLRGLRIHVLEDSPDLVRECSAWSWKQDKEGRVLPLVADGNDHLIDALVYRVYRPGGTIDEKELEATGSKIEPLPRSMITSEVAAL